MHRARSEDGRTGEAGKKEEREVWEEQAEQDGQDKRDEREETTQGKGAPADEEKKLRRGRLIFRKKGAKAL